MRVFRNGFLVVGIAVVLMVAMGRTADALQPITLEWTAGSVGGGLGCPATWDQRRRAEHSVRSDPGVGFGLTGIGNQAQYGIGRVWRN